MVAGVEAKPLTSLPEPVDLRRIAARDLEPLLEEEIAAWSQALDWDFSKAADVVLRFVAQRSLLGCALVEEGQVVGYSYYVVDESKGIVGDLYVRRRWRGAGREMRLLGRVIEELAATPGIGRVEAQLMMLDSPAPADLPRAGNLDVFARNYMRLDLGGPPLAEARLGRPVYLEKWSHHYQEAAAQLIAAAYAGHIDGRINDQYRSPAGARRFLYNIVQHPGCGAFFAPASWAAFEGETGKLCGISLASMVAPGAGHITQICVSPGVRARGVGYALLRQSIMSLRQAGCASASLTVTAANRHAVDIYERVGFGTLRRFSAFVWEW
jgi:ribosomal protein S18 acetylase RimI-like enzyme